MAPDHDREKGHRIFIIITHVSPRFPINLRWPYLSPCAGSHIEASRVRPIGRRRRSGHWNQTKRVAPPQVQGGMAQTSRDSPAAVIPQAVTPRTRCAGRSGTHKAHARGGAGAGEPPHSAFISAQPDSRSVAEAVWRSRKKPAERPISPAGSVRIISGYGVHGVAAYYPSGKLASVASQLPEHPQGVGEERRGVS